LLSGLLRCGVCGGGLSSGNANVRRRLYCTNHRESGSCGNSRMFYSDDVEARVLNGLRTQLSNPEAISRFIQTYTAERKRLAESGTATRADLERKLARAELALQRAVRAMIESSAPIASFNAEH
jgi:site-specific DNA recombinase